MEILNKLFVDCIVTQVGFYSDPDPTLEKQPGDGSGSDHKEKKLDPTPKRTIRFRIGIRTLPNLTA